MPKIRGVIVSWSRERGHGSVECDEIGLLTFDGGVVTEEDLHVGDAVSVEFAEVSGRRRIVRVEPDLRWLKRT
jgi:hypothetical protein